jgi:crotonobetainyl-CoA:carnitine CoA-transferase CaiB-like acyl-CoA transferase
MTDHQGSLHGVRVIDMSRILAGPWATQMLGDLGAEVIKIERPGAGDDTRGWGPPYLRDAAGQETSESAFYLAANRNKKSVAIDVSQPAGSALVQRLAANADIFVENFKVGGLAKYGLDYATLSAANPRLIYCSISGFGQSGPYAERAGYDFLIQAMGGLMSITGAPDGEPGAGPQKVGVGIVDIMTGLNATIAILAALNNRTRTGRGQHVEASLLDSVVSALANQASQFLLTGQTPARLGNAHPNIAPYQDFPTADGSIIIAVGNDAQFTRMAEAMDHPEWAQDQRFSTNRGRVENRELLVTMMRKVTRGATLRQWMERLEVSGVPCGPVNDIAEVFNDPHVVARGLRFDMAHSVAGQVPLVANPIRLNDAPVTYRLPPPLLGQHTADVLSQILGLDTESIKNLETSGVIQST